jgi:hypothetical protein
MSEISDFIFEVNTEILKKVFEQKCKEYEPDFVIKKVFKDKQKNIIGILIYFDNEGVRWILEGHTKTDDVFLFYRNWRGLFKDKNIHTWKATVQKVNEKMVKFYKNMKFQIIAEDAINVYLELRR